MNRLVFKKNNELQFLDFEEIIFIEKYQKKTIIHTKKDEINIYESLNSLYKKLNRDIFIRTHKSYIVNINHILKITPWGQKTYRVLFKNIKNDALFSYKRYREFKETNII